MSLPGQDATHFRGEVLAWGPEGDFRVTVETKYFYRGRSGRYYRTPEAAQAAETKFDVVEMAMPEFTGGIMRTAENEFVYADPRPVFAALRRFEQRLASLPGREGSQPSLPARAVLPAGSGWELTHLGNEMLVGPRPAGDWPGAHVHHTFGVPLAGLYRFLRHVRDNTWRDESRGYLTRAHLDDALGFATGSPAGTSRTGNSCTAGSRPARCLRMTWWRTSPTTRQWRSCAGTPHCSTPAPPPSSRNSPG